jgi:hypothetical protein
MRPEGSMSCSQGLILTPYFIAIQFNITLTKRRTGVSSSPVSSSGGPCLKDRNLTLGKIYQIIWTHIPTEEVLNNWHREQIGNEE